MRRIFREALPAFAVEYGIAEEKADEMFNYGIRQTGLDRLTAGIVGDDLDSLQKAAASVTGVVNSWIAHTSKAPQVSSLKLNDLHDAADVIQEVFSRYHALVIGNKPPSIPFEDFDCRSHLEKIWPRRA